MTLGVGIIGVNPAWGWAATAHIPALRALPNYEIRGLSSRSAESARVAGKAFGIKAVFPDHEQLVIQPDIDVVAVTVKVPHHRELVSAALAAGKAVYCEWPLGRDLDEARAMAALAAEKGVRTVVGLQARQAPAIEFVQQLLSDGYVGEVLSTSMIGLSVLGGTLVQPNAYMLDKTNGANVLTVAFGHSLDTLNYVLGEFAELSAVSDLRRPLITIEGTGEQIVKTAPDQIAVIGTLKSGATASVHIREAVAGGTGFLWEINGTDGTLRITADAALPEIFPLTVAGARGRGELAELAVPTALTQKWPMLANLEGAPAFNVARQPGRSACVQRRSCLRRVRGRHRQRDSHRAGLRRRRSAPRGHRRHREVCGRPKPPEARSKPGVMPPKELEDAPCEMELRVQIVSRPSDQFGSLTAARSASMGARRAALSAGKPRRSAPPPRRRRLR